MAEKKGLWIPQEILDIKGIDLEMAVILSKVYSYEEAGRECFMTDIQFGVEILKKRKAASARVKILESSGLIAIINPCKPTRKLLTVAKMGQLKSKVIVPHIGQQVPHIGTVSVSEWPRSVSNRDSINKEVIKINKELINTPVELAQAPSLHKAIEGAFLSKVGKFTDYKREGKSIKGLITKAKNHSPDDPWLFINELITRFYSMRKTDKFFSRQPFTPSTLNTLGIFDRVMVGFETENKEIPEELRHLYKEIV